MDPANLVFILSDEHQRDIAGCYGDRTAITPNIDALAARGARFTNAYTPCPICVPARAALATGQWVHQTKAWDNAAPYHALTVTTTGTTTIHTHSLSTRAPGTHTSIATSPSSTVTRTGRTCTIDTSTELRS